MKETNKIKNILYIMHMPPPYAGASMVGKRIKDSALINKHFNGTYINLSLADSIETMGRKPFSKITKYIKLLKEISKKTKQKKYDLCYITPTAAGIPFIKDYFIIQLIKKANIPIIIHFHNKGVSKYQHKFIYNILYKSFFKGIKVLLLSPMLYYDISKYVLTKNTFYSYVGLPNNNNILTKGKSNIVQFCFISLLLPEKGVYDLLDACKILKNKGYNFRCIIAGRTTHEIDETILQNAIYSRSLNDKIIYKQVVSEEDKNSIFASSHAFVFPTYYKYECFPAAILEAMRNKTAVISTYEGAIPDEVQHGINGFLIKQHDIENLANRMEEIIQHPDVAIKMGNIGYTIFKERFLIESFDLNLINIFNNIINEKQ